MPFEHLHSDSVQIREVWRDNLQSEFDLIDGLVVDFPYIAFDTEFPGSVVPRIKRNKGNKTRNYDLIKENVNRTKVVQLGFTFCDVNGNLPKCGTEKSIVWQFNFYFNPDIDEKESGAMEFLSNHGINIPEHTKKGIDARKFGELLVPSGAVMNDDVFWLVFHGGTDFGYLFRALTGKKLPDTEAEFYMNINTFFPNFYDLKNMVTAVDKKLGLDAVAAKCNVKRIGQSHQAGSDSLVTSLVFLTLKRDITDGDLEEYKSIIFGLWPE